MSILRLFRIFSNPYPADTDTTKQKWSVILVSIFVFLFLFIFQPFGLHNVPAYNRFIICLGYGGCTALAMSLNYMAINYGAHRYQLEEKWTVSKHILWNGWILLTIAFLNFSYSNLIGISSFTTLNLLISLGQVFLIGLFPITIMVLIDHTRLFRKNMRRAEKLREQMKEQINNSSELIVLHSSNSDDSLQLLPAELVYITSADNYVKVVYKNNSTNKWKLLRGTLKYFEDYISHPQIIRCHRSYIINLMQVIDVSVNARGYTLSLRNTDKRIPVSKTYIDQFNQQMAG